MKKKRKNPRIIVNIVLAVFIVLLLLISFSTYNKAIIYTGNYGTGSKEEEKQVKLVFGEEETEDNFNLYFKWFNQIHECGHVVESSNSNVKRSYVEKEKIANRYAAAYWRKYGEPEKYEKLKQIVEDAQSNLTNPAPEGTDLYDWIEENYETIQTSETMFNDYGYFQFDINKEVLNSDETLEEVLEDITGKKVTLEDKNLVYKKGEFETGNKIIDDQAVIIRNSGLKFPNYVHMYGDGSNSNFSITIGLTQVLLNIFSIIAYVLIVALIVYNIVASKKKK